MESISHKSFACKGQKKELEGSAVAQAHLLWSELLKPGDCAVDATCGNGKDTSFLAELVGEAGVVIGLDIQEEAIRRTRERTPHQVQLFLQSHEEFPPLPKPPKLIVYNLGYLPGGNKAVTTLLPTTLKSIKNSLNLLPRGGALSIICYPGHEEGKREAAALLELLNVPPFADQVSTVYRNNSRPDAPFLIYIIKN